MQGGTSQNKFAKPVKGSPILRVIPLLKIDLFLIKLWNYFGPFFTTE